MALTEASKAKVQEMGGNVGYIVATDYEHHIFISEWAKAFPGAKIIGVEGLPEKRAKANDDKIGNEEFSVVFTRANKRELRISDEFDADFDYEYVDGHANKELVFVYKPDKVLIEADFMFNVPANEQYSKMPPDQRPESAGFLVKAFMAAQNPQGDPTWNRRFNWYLLAKNRASFNDSVKVIDQWDFTTVIPCHGDVIEGDGKEVFRKVFHWHLEGKKH